MALERSRGLSVLCIIVYPQSGNQSHHQGSEDMQHDIGCEMPQHGAFQSIFPVQPAESDPDQAIENDCTRDD